MKRLEDNRDAWFLEFLQNLPALAWAKDGAGRYVFVNTAAAEAFGKPESEILGSTDFDIFAPSIAEGFRRNDELAAKKGSALQTIEVLPDRNGVPRYSLVTKFPVSAFNGDTHIAGTALDITDQRTAYAHQEFLFGISEKIRVATEANELLSETATALGKFIGVDRCLFNEIDLRKDVETVRSEYETTGTSVVGQHRVSAYSPETTALMKEGRTVVNRDSKTDERTSKHFDAVYEPAGERSYVAVPMMRNGRWVASLWCSSRETRNWTDQETQLIETVAERTWAAVERLRSETALQGNYQTFLGLIQSAPFGVYLVDSEFRLAQISSGSEKVFSNIDPLIGRDFAEILRIIWPEPFATEAISIFRHTLETGEPYHAAETTEQRGNEPVVESYDWQVKRVTMPDGSYGVVCYFYDLTELRQAQDASRRAAIADAFRVRLSDRLRQLSDPVQIQSAAAEVVGEELKANRVAYFEIKHSHYVVEQDYVRGVESVVGTHAIASFGKPILAGLSTGRPIWSNEVAGETELSPAERAAFAALDIAAHIAVPLVKNGELVAGLTVQSVTPRIWREDQISLVEEAAERTWAAVERARAEGELRKSEERFRAMIENLPGGAAFVVDRDLRYVLADGEALALAGVRREDLIGRTIFEVLPEDISAEYEKNYRSVLAGEHFDLEHSAHGRTFVSRGTPLRDDRGDIYAVLAVSYDITERTASEEAVRESESRFRNMADNAPVMIWVTDEAGSCSYLSRSWYEFTGQTPETGLGSGFVKAMHPDDRESDAEKFMRAVADASEFYSEHRLQRADGSYGWMICKAQPRFSESGKFVGHIGSVLEITDRKIAEEQLRESRDLNQSVIDSIPAHIAVLDTEGKITLVNTAWEKFAAENGNDGSIEGASLGTNYLTVCEKARGEKAPDAAAIYEGIRGVLDREIESFSLEYPCHSPTADRWFLLTVTPLIGGGAVISHLNITERRIAEEEIRSAADRLRLAQQAGNVGIWDWNAASNQTYWSDQMWAFYATEPRDENPNEKFWPEHLHKADKDRVLDRISRLLVGAETEYRDEFRIVRDDGEVRWIASSATVERSRSGNATRMYGVNIDITERKSIEERIRASETQVRLITDSIPALVSYIDRDNRYRFVNRRYTQWFGRSEDEILGQTMTEVLGKAAVVRLRPYVERALSGERVDFERWLDYKGAGRRFVRVSYVPDLSQEGVVAGFYALVTDFTDQQRSEELLRYSEERMKVLTESFTDYAILSTDSEGKVQSWNPGAENIFGHSEDEIVGTSAERLFTPEDVAVGVPEEEMRKAREFGRASDERWHLRKDGSRFFASGVMAPLYEAGQLTGYAKIATDLTEKRRQAEELQRAYEEMENRVLDRTQELASANDSLREQVSERRSAERQRILLLQRLVTTQEVERKRIARDLHDQLGQRLTALRLKLAALSALCESQPELYARAVRLQQIAELLDSEVSFLTWQLRPTALDELGLADALQTFVGEWSRHYNKPADFHVAGIKELHLSPEVETQVYRITQEALNNVVKHAEATSVSVILERVGRLLVLIVEDNGVGFDADSLDRKPEDRHGVGLPGMKERAELIGSEVEVESTPGSGTTIYLRIPLDDSSMEGRSL